MTVDNNLFKGRYIKVNKNIKDVFESGDHDGFMYNNFMVIENDDNALLLLDGSYVDVSGLYWLELDDNVQYEKLSDAKFNDIIIKLTHVLGHTDFDIKTGSVFYSS